MKVFLILPARRDKEKEVRIVERLRCMGHNVMVAPQGHTPSRVEVSEEAQQRHDMHSFGQGCQLLAEADRCYVPPCFEADVTVWYLKEWAERCKIPMLSVDEVILETL